MTGWLYEEELDEIRPPDGGRLPEEADLPLADPERSRGAALLLAERVTGLRLDPEWLLNESHPTYMPPGQAGRAPRSYGTSR